MPEMTFGNNALTLSYAPGPSSSSGGPSELNGEDPEATTNVRLSFSALDALKAVATGDRWEERVGGGVKVSMAEVWGRSR
jgi:type 2A phosphatase activator TIP41